MKSKSETTSNEELEAFSSMRSEYVEQAPNWKEEVHAGESLNISRWFSFLSPTPSFSCFLHNYMFFSSCFFFFFFPPPTVQVRLNDELRIINKEGKVVPRQGVEDLKELLYVARKLFALVDVTLKVLQGEKKEYEKLFRSLFVEFANEQIKWTRKLNEGTISVIVFILIMFMYCEFASIVHMPDLM